MIKRLTLVIAILLFLSACRREPLEPAPEGSAAPADVRPAEPASTAKPSTPPPIEPRAASTASAEPAAAASESTAAAPAADTAGRLKFNGFEMEISTTWKAQPTVNPMRVAQVEWPVEPGDPEPPLMIVFWFGEGGGGGVDANLERWCSQFVESGEGERTAFKTGDASVTVLDKAGTYKEQPSMMSPDFKPRPGWRMLAAVIEIEGGPFFIRATGPDASVAKQREALRAGLKTFRRSPP